MKHPAVIKTAQLVLAGDIKAAEKALSHVAETEGDGALVELLDQLAPKDLLAIMREIDGSRESILNLVVTPKQFAEVVILEKRYAEDGHDRLRGMMNAVLYRDESMTLDYLETLGEKDEGLAVLADYFADRVDEVLSFAMSGELQEDFSVPETMEVKSITWLNEKIDAIDEALHDGDAIMNSRPKQSRAEVADHDWMETAWLLRHELTDTFEQLIITIRDRIARHMEAINASAPEKSPTGDAATEEEESAL
jgi:hypothetical protein